MSDLQNLLSEVLSLNTSATSDNTALTGTGVDLSGFRSNVIQFISGSLADADATFAVEIQESDASGSGYTAVADSDLSAAESTVGYTFSEDNVLKTISYKGRKRYIRPVITPSNNASSAAFTVVVVRGDAMKQPV